MKNAAGVALKLDGGQHGERVVRPLRLGPGQTGSYRYTVTMSLPRGRELPSVSLLEPTAFWHTFHDLRPGEYTLQLVYQCHDAKLGGMALVLHDKELTPDTPLWAGKAVSSELKITVKPGPAPAAKPAAPEP